MRQLRKTLFFTVFLTAAVALCSFARGQDSLADLESFRAGCQALADERYETAVTELLDCWEILQSNDTGDAEKNFVAVRLLEAMVKNGASARALDWVQENPLLRPLPGTSLWIAIAFQKEERFAEAADSYNLYLSSSPDAGNTVLINRSICLARSGRPAAAHELVHGIVSPEKPEEALRIAQIAAAASEFDVALQTLAGIGTGDAGKGPLRFPIGKLKIWILNRTGFIGAALESAYQLIDSSPDATSARLGFLLLEQLPGTSLPAGFESRIEGWANAPDFPGREAARLFQISFLSDPGVRETELREFSATVTDTELLAECLLRLAERVPGEDLLASFGERDSLDADLLERIEFAGIDRDYLTGAFETAVKKFAALADSQHGENRSRNLHNAAVSALSAGDTEGFAGYEEALGRNNPRSLLLANLSYLGALYFAAAGDPQAFDRLNAFVRENPEHPLNIDAQLALAEIHLNQAPARSQAAREIFDSLRTRPLTLIQSERLDYTSVWVEFTDSDIPALIRRAEQFVSDWPSSPYLQEVLMILATKHFGLKNMEAASGYFKRVSDSFPDSPLAETARFFDAKSSPNEEETIAKWRRIIESGGSLAGEARHELGLLFLASERFDEAHEELEWLVENQPAESNLRFAAMADLGFASYLEALTEERDPALLEEAAGRFASLSGMASAPAFWRYNAAVRRGKCLEALGKSAIALEIYRSIVDETGRNAPDIDEDLPPGESEWVFRAGFAAIDILAAEENWAAAISVADTLSGKDGPRAIEAEKLGERMRLQHWVWD